MKRLLFAALISAGLAVADPATVITAVSPTGLVTGGPGGNISLTIVVDNDLATGNSTVCRFNGVPVGCNAAANLGNGQHSFVATIPSNLVTVTGAYALQVLTTFNILGFDIGTAVAGTTIHVSPQPSIGTVVPGSIVAGVGQTALTINGSGFINGAVVTWTTGAGTTNLTTTVIAADRIDAVVPANLVSAPVSAQLKVINPGSISSPSFFFGVVDTAITLNPNEVAAGAANFQLVVNGSNFTTNGIVCMTGTGAAGSCPAGFVPLATGFVTANQITAIVPSSLVANRGQALIVVANPGGQTQGPAVLNIGTAAAGPTIVPTAGTSTGVTPETTGVRNTDLAITVNGVGFTSNSVVRWAAGGVTTSLSTNFNPGNGTLTALIPATLLANPGSPLISVLNPVTAGQTTGTTSNAVVFPITPVNAPIAASLTSLSPGFTAAGGEDFILTILGAGFSPGATTQWISGGVTTQLSTFYGSNTRVTAVVPRALIAAAGVASITVTNPTVAASSPLPFTIVDSALTLNPNSAPAGGLSFALTVNGRGFANGSVVCWAATTGGPPPAAGTCPANSTTLATGFVTNAALTAIVPASLITARGTAIVTVSNPDGTVSGPVVFQIGTLADGPTIDPGGLAPSTALAGTPDTQIQVTGKGFGTGSTVQWTTAAGVQSLRTSVLNATTLTAIIPASLLTAPGFALVSVLNTGGAVSNAQTFTIGSLRPTISVVGGIEPASTQAPATGNVDIAIQGTGFTAQSIASFEKGGVVKDLATSFVDSSHLTARILQADLQSVGLALIRVRNANNLASDGVAFTVNTAGSLALTNMSVTRKNAGSPSFQLTLTGTGFQSGAVISWNPGVGSATQLAGTFSSPTQLDTVIPSTLVAAPGVAWVQVINPGNVVSLPLIFTIDPAVGATVDSLNPATKTAGDTNFTLTVTGSNFANGAIVRWDTGAGAQNLSTGWFSANELRALVPSTLIATAGPALVAVQNPGGVPISNSREFQVIPQAGTTPPQPPTILKIEPTEVVAGAPGQVLKINGTSFASSSIILWNAGGTARQLSTGYVSPTELNALLTTDMLAAPGAAFVTVQNPGSLTSNAQTFRILSPSGTSAPRITNINPTGVPAGSASFSLIITGSAFTSGSIVQWDNGSGVQNLATGATGIDSGNNVVQLTAVVPSSLVITPGQAIVKVQNPGGSSSNAVSFTVGPSTGNAPRIDSLDPSTIAAGSTVPTLRVTGINFANGAVVRWDGGSGSRTLTTGFTNSDGTLLTALVPADLTATPGTAFVTVVNPSGTSSNTRTFTITGSSPTVSSLSPTSAIAGTPGLSLVITGTNFQSGSSVLWGTTPLPAVNTGTSQLTVTVPGSLLTTPGTVTLQVISGSLTSATFSFTVAGPTIVLVSPNALSSGAPAFTLTVGGANFLAGSTVIWGSTPLTTTFVGSSQLTASVPASLVAAAGSFPIVVQNPGGATSQGFVFVISGAPVVSAVVPAALPAGAGAQTIVVSGSNFSQGDLVQWNGVGLQTTFGSAAQLSASLPASLLASAGAANVTVLGSKGVPSNAVQVIVSLPSLTTVSPSSAASGTSSFQLNVTGASFIAGSTVFWNGTSLPTTFLSATQLTAVVDTSLLSTPSTPLVSVANTPAARSVEVVRFTISGPAITSLSPTTITASSPALTLAVTGTNFVQGSTVQWNGSNLITSFGSATQLTAQVPANLLTAPGAASITVTNPGGAVSAPSVMTVTVPPAPTVSDASPGSKIAGEAAFQITINGTGFQPSAIVQWNGNPLPTTVISATRITALVASNLIVSSGTVNIVIQNPVGPQSTPFPFTVTGPSITSLAPSTVAAGAAGFELTVTGQNFLAGTIVFWNGAALPTVLISGTQLSARVPASYVSAQGNAIVTVGNPPQPGGAMSPAATFVVGPFNLVISTNSLPDGYVGREYSQLLAASGGTPPYTWALTSGALPVGLALNASTGSISGVPTAAGASNLTVSVTDSAGRTLARQLTLQVDAPLQITTTSPLPSVLTGVPYAQTILATGGTQAYRWSSTGTLPPGLALNQSSGQISGTPTTAGNYRFEVRLNDSRTQEVRSNFDLQVLPAVPQLTFNGLGETVPPAQQPRIDIVVANPYPVDITGTLFLTFTSDVGVDDPAIQFSVGGRRVGFTIPAGSNVAVFDGGQPVSVATGTVAGSLVFRSTLRAANTDITPVPAPGVTSRVLRLPPVITNATLTKVAGGITVTMTGYSTPREMVQATFQFVAAQGATLNTSQIVVPLAETFTTWYSGSASAQFGSQFTISLPFKIEGDLAAIGSVSVTLTNKQGSSAPVSATFQ